MTRRSALKKDNLLPWLPKPFQPLDGEMRFREAGEIYIESRTFAGGQTSSRYISPGTLRCYKEYLLPLNRFFGQRLLNQINASGLREYQQQRAQGQLGPSYEELFHRVCKWAKLDPTEAKTNAITADYVSRRIARIKHEEVSATKVNQELSLLSRILKRANCWSPELEFNYEPLQVLESDIPRAITRQEQKKWLEVACSKDSWQVVYHYAVIAFATTASNVELRNLRIGDINLESKTMSIRAATAKNRYRVRTIVLNPDACISFERLLARAYSLGSREATNFLFPFRTTINSWNPEKPMTEWGLRKTWDEVRQVSRIDLTFHGCRHTAITRMAEAGVPMAVIMSMAGHIGPKMTQHYTSISMQAQRWAVEAVHKGECYPLEAGRSRMF